MWEAGDMATEETERQSRGGSHRDVEFSSRPR